MSIRPQKPTDWHALGIAELLRELDANESGLTRAEAEARLAA